MSLRRSDHLDTLMATCRDVCVAEPQVEDHGMHAALLICDDIGGVQPAAVDPDGAGGKRCHKKRPGMSLLRSPGPVDTMLGDAPWSR